MSQGFLRITDLQIYQEYQVSLTGGTTSTAQLITFPPTNLSSDNRNLSIIAIIESRGDNIVYKFGSTSSVTASSTVTSNALVQGNFSVPNGAVFSCTINSASQNYFSAVGETSGSSTAIVRIAVATL